MAHYYNVPVLYVDPLRKDTSKFNPLEGDPILVAEATRTVLQATFWPSGSVLFKGAGDCGQEHGVAVEVFAP